MDTPASMFATLTVDGKPLWVEHLTGHLSINEQFLFRIFTVPVAGSPESVEATLGKAAKLTLTSPLADVLVVTGLLRAVDRYCEHDAFGYQLDLAPHVAPLTVGKNHRLFQKQSVPDIVKKLLSDGNIDASCVEWHVGAHPAREYVVQYGESDWEFITRILADEGINYGFTFAEDATKLSFFDDSAGVPAISGDATLPYVDAASMLSDASVTEVSIEANQVSSAVRLRDYSPKNPALTLDESASLGPGNLEVYDCPGNFEQPSQGHDRAQSMIEALQRQRRLCRGRSNCLRLAPGHKFTLEGHPIPGTDGPLLVVSVELAAHQGLAEKQAQGFELHFSAVPIGNVWRPLPVTAKAMPGPQTAIVCGPSGQEIHTNGLGQVRPQFYWDREGKRDEQSSTWMRVGQFSLGFSMMLPRITWDQIVAFGAGNADAPLVVSHLYDGTNTVPYALPTNKTRTAWQTATTPSDGTSNEIRFEDKSGSEEIFINASRDMTIETGHNSDETVDVDHETNIGSNQDIKVGANQSNQVSSSQTVKVGALETLTVSGNRTVGVGKNDTETVGAGRTVTVSSGATLDVSGGRSLTAGATMVSAAGMGVERAALGSASITVGGAWIAAAGMSLDGTTAGLSTETIGGAKLQAASKGVETNVKGKLCQNVGGVLINSAKTNLSETSEGPMSIKVGAAMIINGPDVLIEAESKISVQVGGTTLTIDKGKIELKSPSLASPGATIAKTGGTVEHNP